MKLRHVWRCLLPLLLVFASMAHAAPQIPDFVYQGRLTQGGAPANGNFDLHFALFDAATGGNQVGTAIDEPAFPVSDGIFSVSLSFPGAFAGEQRYLQVTVGATDLLPRQAVTTAPVAQYSLTGSIGAAGGDLFGSYPNPQIGSGKVTNSKLAAGAVTNSKIAAEAITADKIDNGAVTTAAIASDSITRGKIAGGYSNGAIALSVGAGACKDADVSVSGAQVNDMVIFSLQGAATLPQNFIIQALQVPSDGFVRLRFCNVGASSASTGSVHILTLR